MTLKKCRICMSPHSLINIFQKQGASKISNKIMLIAKIHISLGDGMPNKICSECVIRLNNCLEFIKLCENTDLELRTTLNKSSTDQAAVQFTKIDDSPTYTANERNCFLDCKYSPKSDRDLFIDESAVNDIIHSDGVAQIEVHKDVDDKELKTMKKAQKQQCFTCGKVMSSRFRLKTHLRTHTGERPFSCMHCNKKFSLAQSLKVHMRVHTGEKPLQCSVCGESFAQSAGLAAHKRKHTGQLPYQCVLCPRSFRTVGHLQYHTRRHTGEKNFECDVCGRAFITRGDLKQHMVTHSGERPHVCCVCGLRLSRASHLNPL